MNTSQALPRPSSGDSVPTSARRGGFARIATIGARVLLGLIFFVFGLNGFFLFMPPPPNLPSGVVAFMSAMAGSHYFFPLLAGTQTVCGALLLVNRFVPLALVVLAPVIVNIVAFHVFLAPDGLPLAIVVLALEAYLAWVHRAAYRSVLVARSPAE